jgi:hypothetical protein
MSEYYEDANVITADVDGDGHADVAFVDVNGDGYADKVIFADHAEPGAEYEGGEEYEGGAEYKDGTQYQGGAEYQGAGSQYQGGNTYANDYIDTAVSSSADGSEGYIAVGDGEFVSWG